MRVAIVTVALAAAAVLAMPAQSAELVVNGGFEAGAAPWMGAVNILTFQNYEDAIGVVDAGTNPGNHIVAFGTNNVAGVSSVARPSRRWRAAPTC